MNNKSLAIMGMAGAPFMCVGMLIEMTFPSLKESWFTGAWGLVYLGAWLCTLTASYRLQLFGRHRWPRLFLSLLFVSLCLALSSDLAMVLRGYKHPAPFWFYLDLFWPFSNALMLCLGISLWGKKDVPQSFRRAVLLAGTWLPLSLASLLVFGRSGAVLLSSGFYSFVAWMVLAFVLWKLANQKGPAMELTK